MSPEDIDNRFRFHPARTPRRQRQHEAVRSACADLARRLDGLLPDGREKSTAITNLEQVMFWANAGLARQPEPDPGPLFTCPRRVDMGMDREDSPMAGSGPNLDNYEPRDGRKACSFCGSLPAEDFMAAVRAGAEVVPTDKGYKLYVALATDRQAKFYTPHLAPEQSNEFAVLDRVGEVKWALPGRPYVTLGLPGYDPAIVEAALGVRSQQTSEAGVGVDAQPATAGD